MEVVGQISNNGFAVFLGSFQVRCRYLPNGESTAEERPMGLPSSGIL